MTINLHLPTHSDTLKPKITVIGVGGAGGNAVNNMIAANLEGVDFVMANTDAQALESALTDRTIQLGVNVTRGLGAGANPQIGQAAAEEALDEIADHISGSNMVFITAGMGGGTGTGAAPVIAQMAREQGILTVGVVTKPFQFEGSHRMRMAELGLEELQRYVDTLIVIPNQNLFRVANEKTTFADAFRMADEVLHSGVRGVTDLMVKPGLVNLDFADIRAVMSEMGKAMMGTGEAVGEKRAIHAAESAISNPLLDDVSLRGARAVLINITGGADMTLFEVDEAANRIRDEVDPDANIIFGSTFSDLMEGKMRVSVVATGIIDQKTMAFPDGSINKSVFQPVPKQPEKISKPVIKPMGSSYINTPARPEFKRERSPAEIVRESGSLSATELARIANERKKELEMAEKQAEREAAQAALFVDGQGDFLRDEAAIDTSDNRRKPFRLGEVKEQVDAPPVAGTPAFMAPRPEQPVQRTQMISQKPEMEEDMEDEHDDAAAPESSAFNFFQKIGGFGKAFTREPRAETSAPSVSGASRAAVKEVAEKQAAEDEEYLDIPAFLRRQAN